MPVLPLVSSALPSSCSEYSVNSNPVESYSNRFRFRFSRDDKRDLRVDQKKSRSCVQVCAQIHRNRIFFSASQKTLHVNAKTQAGSS